ncbi:MAG: DegV family protein [Clostridiales bacterium]|nr:DegV family protein [Clostridiales bacterium]
MKDYVILTDSCSDLDKADRAKYNIEYIKMHFTCEGLESEADLDWGKVSFADFYSVMRAGNRIVTSQVNALEYKKVFEEIVAKGYDILYLGCSSALSSSVKASYVARDEVMKNNPNAKIVCIDTLNACLGLGILCMVASEQRAKGKSIDEVATWIEKNKKFMHQEATVEKLTWLKMAGRVSATSAFFGGLLNIKPIIICDVNGANVAVEKVKGRKNSFEKIAQRFKENYADCEYQKLYIVHGDCEQDAIELKNEVEKVIPENLKGIEIQIRPLGPIIGASCGPGTLGLYYFGSEVTYDGSKA